MTSQPSLARRAARSQGSRGCGGRRASGTVDAEQPAIRRAAQPQHDRLEPQRIAVDDVPAGRAGADELEQRARALHRRRPAVADRRRARTAMLASVFRPSALLVRRTESGLKYALSSTMVCVSPVTSESAPPMTPATATGALGVGDHQHVRRRACASGRRACEASRRRARSARGSAPPPSFAQIERVHRLPELEQHVVGDVHDVADRPDAGGAQARLHPVGRGADRHVGDGARVARAESGFSMTMSMSRLLDSLRARSAPAATAPATRPARPAGRTRSRPRAPCRAPTCSRAGWR